MAIIPIDDSTNLAVITGNEKLPLGNGSGQPLHLTPDQLKDYSIDGIQGQIDAKQPLATVLTNTTASYTTEQASKLAGIAEGAEVNAVDSVNGQTGVVVITKSDVGLGSVDNTSDVSKPISSATQSALDGKQPIATVLTNTTASFTTAQETKLAGIASGAQVNTVNSVAGKTGIVTLAKGDVGLGNVDNTSDANKPVSSATQTALDAKLATSLKGANSGLAELDSGGKVPSSQLPSFVDDVIEVANFAALPVTGESGKIYITIDDNKTYRWGGSAYAEISASLALGETSTTAYRGDRGKAAYDHSQINSGNPHNVTKSDVGLNNVDNTADASKPISTATQTALDGKAAATHSHVISDVTGLQTALDGKAASSHTHTTADITDFDTGVDTKLLPYETSSELDARDTANRDRANHTGSQAQSTITGLVAALADKLEDADIADMVESTEATFIDALTQASYDGLTPVSTTLYLITDA